MALNCISRFLNTEYVYSGLIRANIYRVIKVQTASIVSKEFRDPTVKKPEPWPYETKKFTFLRGYFEGTLKRFDENTKIIVVEGNIGAGKSALAKQLAEAFDMKYFPEPTMDRYYITPYGYDLRKIDDIVPPSYKYCGVDTFYKNPYHRNVTAFQFRMFMARLSDYIDALAHILNTGQGIVLDRCVYSDFVFLETMFKLGYIRNIARQLYSDINKNVLEELIRPHLIIYLDISPEVCLERIKQRNKPEEVNSKVLNKEYLETIEYFYKQHYLKKMETDAELLIYDWSNYGDPEVVVEDIEKIDFERFSKYDTKLRDWRREDDWEWNHLRRFYTNKKHVLLSYAEIFRPRVEEVYHPAEEVKAMKELLEDRLPGEKYDVGFNPNAGENVWFKLQHDTYRQKYFRIWR